MRLFVCTDHAAHYPVGAASVVVAPDEEAARRLLRAELRKHGLPDDPFTLRELPLTDAAALVLCDGDY